MYHSIKRKPEKTFVEYIAKGKFKEIEDLMKYRSRLLRKLAVNAYDDLAKFHMLFMQLGRTHTVQKGH